ncbi:MAG: type transport system permease protein [Actinomycetota bacterium]|nr:type transport system permease protein [Actinomycetota bacterium]
MTAIALEHYAALSRRSIMNIVRQPIAIIPSLTFPLLFLALNSSALARAIELPGFPPVDSFLQFMISSTIIQGALFGSIAAGSDMAKDIEGGFFDRLIATPVSRSSILVGRLAGSFMLGFVQAFIFFGVASLFGLNVAGGLLGMVGVALIGATIAAGVGAISVAIALRTGSTEAVQGSFPLIFVFLFLSSAFFPRSLMHGWFKSVATLNPLSHMIEAARHQVIYGWDTSQWLTGISIAGAILVGGVVASSFALRARLAEKV